MELYLMRLGSEEKYFLSPERDRFVIGRNSACDLVFTSPHISRRHCEILRVPPRGTLIIKNLKGTNTTHVDDLELQNINNFAELRIGSKIGLGVPLSFATETGVKKANFVFLQLCHSEAEKETDDQDLQQIEEFSSGTHNRPLKNEPSLADTSKQPGPQRQGPTQGEKTADSHPAPQPVSFRQNSQKQQSCHPLASCAQPSQGNSTTYGVPSPQPQNTGARPFSSAPQSQFLQQVPSLQQLPQSKLMVSESVIQSQNSIQEPLSELPLEKRFNEDCITVDHQKLHSADKKSHEHVVYPNHKGSLHTDRCDNTSAQLESSRHGKVNNSGHPGHNIQPEPCLAQGHAHLCHSEPEPRVQTLTGENFCPDNIKGNLQKQESEYKDTSETSNQSVTRQQLNYASSSENQGGLNKLTSHGGTIPKQQPDNALDKLHQDTSVRHQSHIGPSHAAQEHTQSQQLSSQHSVLPIAKSAVEPMSRFDDSGIGDSHNSFGMKSLDAFNRNVHGESSSVRSSCFVKKLHSPWEEDTHKTKPSARIAPVQIQFVDSLQAESGTSQQSSVEKNVPQPEIDPYKGLLMSSNKEDSSVEISQSLSSSRNQPLVHKSTPVDSDSLHTDLNCVSSVLVSGTLSSKETSFTQEQFGGASLMRGNSNEHCTIGVNNSQNENSKVDSVRLKPSRNLESVEEKHRFGVFESDDMQSPISIDLTQPDPEPKEKIERENNVKAVIMKNEDDEENFSCEEVCLIDDCKENLSSTELKDVLEKRKKWINEKPSKEGRNANKINNQNRKKAWLNDSPMSLDGGSEKDLDGNSETDMPVQHTKTGKRKRLVIDSDDSTYESFEPDKKGDSETNQVRSMKCIADEKHTSSEDDEVSVYLVHDSKGNSSLAELKDVPRKRKRWTKEKQIKKVRNETENNKQDVKKVRLNELSMSLSDMPVKDLGSDSETELLVQHRKTNRKKGLVIESDSDSSDTFSCEPNREVVSETVLNNPGTANQGGLRSTVNDWTNKECRIAVKRLPSNIVGEVMQGKIVLADEHLDLAVKSSLPKFGCQDSEVGAHTSDKKNVIVVDDDDDDDDDELPDINIPCIKIESSDSPQMSSSRCEEIEKQINGKLINNVKGSRDGVDTRGKDKIKGEKIYGIGKEHIHQSSHDEQYRSNKQDVDTVKSINQGVNQIKNLDLEGALLCRNENSSESVPAVVEADAEQRNKSNVSLDVKSAQFQNVVVKKEKLEETEGKENEVEKGKVAECENSGMIIKKEPGENSEKGSNMAVDDDDDDVIFMYSQVDETIWVSSDEETTPSQNISFGPLPSSPVLDIEELFREDEEQKLNKDVKNKVVDDDLWFPVLSQSFFSDDELDFKTKSVSDPPQPESLPDSSHIKETYENHVENVNIPDFQESLPGPSGINKASENDESIPPIHKWWPELSQGFSDDDAEIDNAFKDSKTLSGNLKSLDTVIEKLKKKDKRGVQLTDPKIPQPRTKSDNIRKRGKRCQETYGVQSWKESDSKSVAEEKKKDMDHEELLLRNQRPKRKSRERTIETPPQKRKQKKGPSLRDNLTSKFNLQSYKATVEHKPREKHHLLPRINIESERIQTRNRKSHLVTDKPRAEENISVQSRNESDPLNQKSRTKVAAKVTHKTRSQRLIDVNLFPSPDTTLPKLRKPKYKIPKSSDKSEEKQMETEGGISPISASCDEDMPGSIPSQPSQLGAEEQNTHDNDQGTRGIIKMDTKRGNASKKTVHFPSKVEELVQALLISPRKNSEKAGKLAARAREVLPREVRLQNCHVPSNYMEHFIYHICRWNYDWLEAYRAGLEKQEASGKGRIVQPPPVVTSTNYPTLILYNSYDDYREIFSNLMYLEIWENVYQDWVKYRQSNVWLPSEIDVMQPAFVGTGSGSLKLWIVKMFTLITHEQSVKGFHPRQGSLISLRIQEGARKMHIFGHVEHFTKHRKRMVSKELEKACPNADVCLMMGVQVAKEITQNVKCGKIIFISNVSYIRPSTRTWEGLCKLPLSPLCWDILKPSKDVFSCNHGGGEYLIDGMPLNGIQKKAVIEVSSKCIYDQHLPKMSLIHGPPGTGKTRTITALIAQIIKLSHETQLPFCRILLCAPSNAAVDELTLRLVRLREIGIYLRIVRVGVRESINSELKNCTLDALVQKQIKMELSTPKNLSTKQEWERRNTMVEHAAEDLQNARKANKSKEVIKQMEIRLTELARSKAEFERSFHSQPTVQERHHLQKKWQYQVLVNAEVITTTLGGCMSGVMAEVFRFPNNFTCCIIDEAGQCKETETWLPLLLGVRKLVLVGDHRQLPATVLSQLAQNKNLKQSLFERLYHRFVIELQLDSLVHTLNVQYRMHPEIVEWPSEHFYMNKLKTNSYIVPQRNCDWKPYIVFDLKTSKEQKTRHNELYNPSEAALVRLLLEILEPNLKKQKVGVITPYQRQKIHLEEKLARFFGRMNLIVNTIDAFQGQERDIIILSFVRGNPAANIGFLSQRQRLNVALTRARRACFIVANLSSLSGNKDWQSLIKNAERRGLVHAITHKEENDKGYIKSILLKKECK